MRHTQWILLVCLMISSKTLSQPDSYSTQCLFGGTSVSTDIRPFLKELSICDGAAAVVGWMRYDFYAEYVSMRYSCSFSQSSNIQTLEGTVGGMAMLNGNIYKPYNIYCFIDVGARCHHNVRTRQSLYTTTLAIGLGYQMPLTNRLSLCIESEAIQDFIMVNRTSIDYWDETMFSVSIKICYLLN